MLAPFPGKVDELRLLGCEVGTGPSRPCFDAGDILGLYLAKLSSAEGPTLQRK
jgi:hypothetical protein